VHKTNSLLRPNFQFVSISKRNDLFYPYVHQCDRNENKNIFVQKPEENNENETKRILNSKSL
jgi:hypothetical protein